MNKAASLAVKSLLGVGSVAGAASGGIILWNKKSSGSTKNVEVSESHKNKEEVREEDKGNQKAPERVEDQENSKNDKEGKADERGSHKTQDELQITGNSLERREADDKGSLKQQIDAEDPDDPEVKARKEEEAKQMEKKSRNWKGWQFSLWSEEASWLSEECSMDRKDSYIECSLTSGDLKKIKFKDLGDGDGDVTVTPNDKVNIKLKIFQGDDLKKKFLFTNESSSKIVVSKGGNSVALKANGKTEFLREEEGLATEKLKDYGIPEKCVNAKGVLVELKPEYKGNKNVKQCILTAVDLSKIKFHRFPDGVESVVTPLWLSNMKGNWKHNQAIILTINGGKYGFYNYFSDILRDTQGAHRPITITRNGVSVVLEGNIESEFTVEGDALKKEEVNVLGFPKRCEIGDEQDKTCELFDSDIKRLKFKKTGVSPDLWNVKSESNKEMNLRIEKDTDNSTYPDGKKYILSAKGNDPITIYNTAEVKDGIGKEGGGWSNSLQFDKDVEKTFKNEGDYLVEVFQ